MSSPLLLLLFFLSGISGLVYQVVWVRELGYVFGNTIHSASLVVAIFMLGLGVGSYAMGVWADRRYAEQPDSLLRVYGWVEVMIGALGFAVSLLLPHLGGLVAATSAYTEGPEGWQVLTLGSYVVRGALAVVVLAPITLLMGGTLTLLIRYRVRADLRASGWTVAVLYGVNTAGAALGALLTDFALVPALGLFLTQVSAAVLNLVVGGGAFVLAALARPQAADPHLPARPAPRVALTPDPSVLGRASLVLGLAGFAGLGLEILWLRHASIMLGGFRSVFALLLTVMLVGIGAGSLAGGWIERRRGRAAETLMVVQGLFVVAVLWGLASVSAAEMFAEAVQVAPMLGTYSPLGRAMVEVWYNLRPVAIEMAIPALLLGFSFPLANAVVQQAERAVGRRAGALYLANTAGAVAGSLVTGYVLLPLVGMQAAATVLCLAAAATLVPLYLLMPSRGGLALGGGLATAALVAWLLLPGDYLAQRAVASGLPGEQIVAVSEGSTELIAVIDAPGVGRGLLTNGHAMSSTAPLDQRYMRALAHVPLLVTPDPGRVLVIGFGVGNTTHAATLHPSVSSVEVADLSRHVLEQAHHFAEANGNVLQDPKVSVYVNDGRQHLQMMEAGRYDLITLEPPPVAHAGVASLYSREFYELARTRLAPGGYVSQWLPAYQVPAESSLAMVRAFIDVFPQAVLISGTQAELLLLGTTADQATLDPAALNRALRAAPAVRADLIRFDMGTPREIVGSFVGSAATLAQAAADVAPVTDDRPMQEYGVWSRLAASLTGVPATLFDLDGASAWCPACFDGSGGAAPAVAGLDVYFALLGQAYSTPATLPRLDAETPGERRVMGSRYLGSVLPDTAEVHNILGVAELRANQEDVAAREFEAALARDPDSINARRNLGQLRYDQGARLLQAGRAQDAALRFQQAVTLVPAFAEAYNDLGVALASQGLLRDAIEQFRQAVALQPGFAEARDNLAAAVAAAR